MYPDTVAKTNVWLVEVSPLVVPPEEPPVVKVQRRQELRPHNMLTATLASEKIYRFTQWTDGNCFSSLFFSFRQAYRPKSDMTGLQSAHGSDISPLMINYRPHAGRAAASQQDRQEGKTLLMWSQRWAS